MYDSSSFIYKGVKIRTFYTIGVYLSKPRNQKEKKHPFIGGGFVGLKKTDKFSTTQV